MQDDSFAPTMFIACIAYEDRFLLDAKHIEIESVSKGLSGLVLSIDYSTLTRGLAVPEPDMDRSSAGSKCTCRRRNAR